MTKTEILKELTTKSGLWNNTKIVQGIKVSRVAWHVNQWKVINDTTTYNDVKYREFTPIKEFYYQQELADYIVSNSKKGKL